MFDMLKEALAKSTPEECNVCRSGAITDRTP